MKKIFYLVAISLLVSCTHEIKTPIEIKDYKSVTSYEEMISFIKTAEINSDLIKVKYIGTTLEARTLQYLLITNDKFGKSEDKLKVMLFAAQHGNEQSSKEGALTLLANIVNGDLDYLFDHIDLILIPNVNPDGTSKDQRRNSNDYDLNRNHLILSENETIGLHKIFNKYLPEVTLDVHEYSPYSKSWIESGYIKNYDEQFGTLTNPNIANEIIKIQKENFLPFMNGYLSEKGFTFSEYVLGGPPSTSPMRYSTVDINDGRQGFGILHSFSFILEGKNGRETLEKLEHRVAGQYEAMKGFLEFAYNHYFTIKKTVKIAREKLTSSIPGQLVAIRMDHVEGDGSVKLKLLSVSTGNDTLINVDKFRTKVEPHVIVKKPKGYLIPKLDKNLTALLEKHNLTYSTYKPKESDKVNVYLINSIGKKFAEGEDLFYPKVEKKLSGRINHDDYFYIPINQLASNLIVTAFEPESMLGLIQYKEYEYLLKADEFPILRVE